MKELENRPKLLKDLPAPHKEQYYEPISIPRAPRDLTTNQRVHMEGTMTPAAYVAEDGLVGHQREERPLVLRRLDAPVQGNARTGNQEWVSW